MASKMSGSSGSLSKSPRPGRKVMSDSAYSDASSDHSVSELKDVNYRLRTELEGQRGQLRQLQRDKQLEVKQLQDKSQTKLAIALKELRIKLHQDKAKEIVQIKEAQMKKMETELHKIVKQKDMEIYRLHGDLDRLQNDMQEMSKRGLSGGARGVFVAERTRLAREVHELRSARRQADDHVTQLQQTDRQSRAQLKKLKSEQEEALASVKAGYDTTIRKLEADLEEQRSTNQRLEQSLRSSNDHVTQLNQKFNDLEHGSRDQRLQGNQQPEVQDKGPPGGQEGNEEVQESQASFPSNIEVSGQLDELRHRAAQLGTTNSQLQEEKALLEKRLQETEAHLTPMKEKVRSYLEKNMILSAKNVNFDEQLKQLKADYHSLHIQLSEYEHKGEKIIERVKSGTLEDGAVVDQTELNQLKECIEEQDKTIDALKVACNEKDRRIEVLVQRQRKRRQKKVQQKIAGVKETYFGYDEDKSSVDSEISSTGRPAESTLDDEDIADELSRAEYEQSYQRLLREHLELEKAFALLQAQSSAAQDKEASFVEEREKLCLTVRKLQEKMAKYKGRYENMQGALQEAREQNEEMEFRLLELEETREIGKTSEELTFQTKEDEEADEEAIRKAAEFANLKDLEVATLITWLKQVKSSKGSLLDLESRHVGFQAEALINNLIKKLEELSEKFEATNELLGESFGKTHQLEVKAKRLEQAKAELQSSSDATHTEIVFAHEQALQQLEETRKRVGELETQLGELEKAEAVHKYTEDYNQKTEQRLKEEITTLRRQFASSNEGRNYEAEFIKEKLDLIKVTEQKIKDYETKQHEFEGKVGHVNDLEVEVGRLKVIEREYHILQQEHAELSEHYAQRSDDEHSLAESDKETAILLSTLKSKVIAMEAKETELLEKTDSLFSEVTSLQVKVKEQEQTESQLQDTNMSLQDELKDAKDRIHRLLEGMDVTQPEPTDTIKDGGTDELEKLRTEVADLREQLRKVTGRSLLTDDLEKQLADLQGENTTLKDGMKVKDLEVAGLMSELESAKSEKDSAVAEQDKVKVEFSQMEEQLIHSRQEIAQLKFQLDDLAADSPRADKIHDLQKSEKKLKDKCQTMEAGIQVLKSTLAEAVSKEKQTEDETKALLKSEVSLRCQLEDYVDHATQLEEKINELEGNNKTLEHELKKVELEKIRLANKLDALRDLEGQVKDLSEVKDQTKQLEHVRHQLQEKLELLQAALNKEEEKSKEQGLHLAGEQELNQTLSEQLADLQDRETALKAEFDAKREDEEAEKLRNAQLTLQTQVVELQQKLDKVSEKELQAKDAVALVGEEKDRHIDQLTNRLTKMEDNEARLLETIHDLEEMEKQLQAQLHHREEQEDRLQEYEMQIATFHEHERDMLHRIEELTETKTKLQANLTTMELKNVGLESPGSSGKSNESNKTDASEKTDSNRSYKDIQKIIELESKIQELTDREAQLLEQTYQVKMENQEMHDHLEQLLNDADELTSQPSERSDQEHERSRSEIIDELRSKVKELEQNNDDLKSKLLKSKLDAMETTQVPLGDPDILELREELLKVKTQLEIKLEENTEQREKINRLRSENVRQESRQGELEAEVKRKTSKCERLENKCELLTEAESRLMERVEQLEDTEGKLRMDMARMKSGDSGETLDDEKDKKQLEEKVGILEEQVQELQGKRQTLKVRLSQVEEKEGEELQRLREKVDLLLDTEEKLLDRIQEQEEIEAQLRKQLEGTEQELHSLEEQLQETHSLSKAAEELASAIDRIGELEQELDDIKQQSLDLNTQAKVKVTTEVVKDTVTLVTAPTSDDPKMIDDHEVKVMTAADENVEVEVTQLKKKEKAYLDHIEELEQKLEDYEELCTKLKSEVVQTQGQLHDIEEEIVVLRKDDKSAEVNKSRARVQELEDGEKVFKQQVNEFQKTISDLEEKMQHLHANYKEDLKEAQARIEELEDAEEQLQDQITKVQQETKSLQVSLDAAISEQNTLHTGLKQTQADEKILLSKLEQALLSEKHVKDKLKESELKKKELQGKLAQSMESLKELESRLQESKDHEKSNLEKVTSIETNEKQIKEQVSKLEEIKSVLEEKLTMALDNERVLEEKLHITDDVSKAHSEKIQQLTENESQLNEEMNKLDENNRTLEVKLDDSEKSNKELVEKFQRSLENETVVTANLMEVMEKLHQHDKEDKIVSEKLQKNEENEKIIQKQVKELEEKLETANDSENRLKNEVRQFEEKLNVAEEFDAKLKAQLAANEEHQKDLNKKIILAEEREKELQEKLEKSEHTERDLRQKLSISEINERSLKEKLLETEEKMTDYNKLVEAGLDNEKSKERLAELEESNKKLRDRITDHEKSGSVLQNKWLSGIEIIEKLEREKSSLEMKLKEQQDETSLLKTKLNDIEISEAELQVKVKDTEKQNVTLMSTLHALKDVNKKPEDSIEAVVSKTQSESFQTMKADVASGISSLNELDTMTKQSMMSRIQEMEYMEKFHLAKISRLQDNLDNFRVAVEKVTVNLEADADIPILDIRPKTKDSEYEAKVQELVRSEIILRSKVHELEKDLNNEKSELAETKNSITNMEADYKEEIEDLEEEIDKLRKSEAKLKNTMNYGGAPLPDGDPLAKIQHLESLVFDLEASERKLKRHIQELLETEQELRSRLEEKEGTETGAHGLVREIQEKDRHYELMTELRMIEMTDRDLKDKLNQLEKEDRETLILRIAEMERKERALNRKIELMEMQETPYEKSSTFDTPEAVMKQRVRQLERTEKHLKTQVLEMERDREDLHEITRKDKNTIHDLNVQLRGLQLTENNLKEQVNRFEVNESHLHMKLDDRTDKMHDLEDQVRKQQVTERQLKAQLHKYQFSESDLNIKFEAILDEAKINEDKLRRKIVDLEKDKRGLTDKTDELADKVSELENVEMTLKQKLRSIENSEASLQGHMKSLEMSETAAKLRALELESLNEHVSDRAHKMEEEKSNLMYEISELELGNQDSKRENNHLQHMVDTLKEKLNDNDASYESMASRLQDALASIADYNSKIEEYQHAEREWQEKMSDLEKSNRKFKVQIEDLQAGLAAKDKTVGLEEESSFLNLRLAQVQKDLQLAEEENMKLHDKLKMYEVSMTSHQMVTLPIGELNDLRIKASKLEKLQLEMQELEKTEKQLRKMIDNMRTGQNPCGHDLEIKELKDKVNRYNNLVQAHQLLKGNYEDVKIQYGQLHKKFKSGDEKVKLMTSNKATHVQLEQQVSLKDITPDQLEELKNALRNLGAKHPEVYQEFIRAFIPSKSSKTSSVEMIETEIIAPQQAASLSAHQGSGQHSQSGSVRSYVDHRPESQTDRQKAGSEDLWKAVESRQQGTAPANSEETFWANIENVHPGEYDDMTIGMSFNDESDLSEAASRPERSSSALSMGSTPPPLPDTIPPMLQVPRPSSQTTESYYLPSSEHPESADEASELDEDPRPTVLRGPRAKSSDRDSDFSGSIATKSSKFGPHSGSLDSMADSGMGTMLQPHRDVTKDKLLQLERLLKNKEKEIEVANVNLRELEKKLDHYEPQSKAKREIHIHKQFTVNQTMEAQMSMMKSPADNQDEELQTLRDEISRLKSFIKAKEDLQTSPDSSGKDIQLLQKELKAKENEVDRLSQELRQWQEECRDAHDCHQKAETSLTFLEDKVVVLQKMETRHIELQREHSLLEEEYVAMKKKQKDIEDAETERADLEEIVSKLSGQRDDLERIDLERRDLEKKLRALETELKSAKSQESELTQENAHMKHDIEARKKENSTYRNMEKEYQRIRSRYEELERTKTKAETLVTPLRAKVIRLAQKCRIKDDLIERLLSEMRRHGGESSDVVAEADRVQSQTATEEYNRPLSPVDKTPPAAFEELYSSSEVFATPPAGITLLSSPPSRTPTTGHTLDPDDLVATHTPITRHSKSADKRRHQRPRSVEIAMLHHQGALSLDDLMTPPQFTGHSVTQYGPLPAVATLPRRKAGRSQAPPTDIFTAIKDYEPQLFSESGHQGLELPLVEGQMVRVLGPVDQHGYYEAEVNGKVGLIPARYLAPLYPHPPHAPRSHLGDRNNNTQGAPEQILSLHKSHMPLRHVGLSPSISPRGAPITHPAFLGLKSPLHLTSLHPRSRPRSVNHNGRTTPPTNVTNGMLTNKAQNGVDGAPEPPCRLEVQRVVGNSALLLSWIPPIMDECGCSNGMPVKGYKLYINGRDKQLMSSPYMTKALVENLNLKRPIQFTLQTVGQHGRMSRPVDTIYEHGSRIAVSTDDTDVSSVVSGSNHPDEGGERRVFLAVYDYNPAQHSSNNFPENELALHTGDIITTYSTVRSDGFYQAKVRGRHGLVPASFIQEVALLRSHSKRSGSTSSTASQHRPSSQSSLMSNHSEQHPSSQV